MSCIENGAADKLIQTLLAFQEQKEWRLGELAAHLAQPKSTVHRNLSSLKHYGLVEQDDITNLYSLGFKAWLFAQSARPYTSLRRKTKPHLEKLANASHETAFFTVVENVYGLCVDRVERGQGLRFSMEVGSTAPLQLGASNLVLLAHLEPAQQDLVLNHWLEGKEERQYLRNDLETICRQGYTYTVAQLTPGVAAIAVPVLTREGQLLGGLSIGGYAERFTLEVAESFLADLLEASRSLADALKVSKSFERVFL